MTKRAAVLAVVDAEGRVLVCRRSLLLRNHAGEVCLPGGMREETDESYEETARRETFEEVSLDASSIAETERLEPLSTLTGITVHPVIARSHRLYHNLSPHPDEVAAITWIPLENFLSEEHHSFYTHGEYIVHVFQFPDHPDVTVFGLTANILILTAMRVLQRLPAFDLNPSLPREEISQLKPDQLIDRFYKHYYTIFPMANKL